MNEITAYVERPREIIGERTPVEIEYDNAVIACLSKGMDIRRAIDPDEALKPEPDHWTFLAERYDYIRQHNEILKKLRITE